MIPFEYHNPESLQNAAQNIDHHGSQAIAGGTTMLDLMKLNVLTPKKLVHVRNILPSTVERHGNSLVIGAGCTMAGLADAADGGRVFPVIRQSLILAASPQIRNMATLGGNLLQRSRSTYYRHPEMPIGGRPIDGFGKGVDTSHLAVLGNRGRLVGMYPGDFAVTLVTFDGELELSNTNSSRWVKAREFYRTPKTGFHYQTVIQPGEIITAIRFPVTESLKNSFYLKIRERSSYAFALASVAVGLELTEDGKIKEAHVGLGGLGSIPWHSAEAEAELVGKPAEDKIFEAAASAALTPANPPAGLEFKVTLAKRALIRALKTLRDEGSPNDEQLWSMQHGRRNQQQ